MNTSFNTLKIEQQGCIGFLKLNRPHALNALNAELLKELTEAARWFDAQKEIKVVIVSGEGRAFCSGADLKNFPFDSSLDESWIERRDKAQVGQRMTDSIGNMRAITIAQVSGFAIGGGLLLMLACDFRIAEENAFFLIPEVDLGIPLGWGGIPKLVSEIGPLKTKELVMTCRRFYTEEALNLRIINTIVKAEELQDRCLKLANELAQKPDMPVIMTKEMVNAAAKQMGSGHVFSADGDMIQNSYNEPESKKAAKMFRDNAMKKQR